MFLALCKGFFTSAGLIMAIGAQNAFILKQGLMKKHLFVTALVASVIDAILICSGVLGFGTVLLAYPLTIQLAKYFAIGFLLFYGAMSLKAALREEKMDITSCKAASLKGTLLLLIGFSLLNPHVYLDTVILLGSVASQQPVHQQGVFAIGAIAASFVWFFSLTYGARLLAPFFSKPITWKILNVTIACMMWGVALSIAHGLLALL